MEETDSTSIFITISSGGSDNFTCLAEDSISTVKTNNEDLENTVLDETHPIAIDMSSLRSGNLEGSLSDFYDNNAWKIPIPSPPTTSNESNMANFMFPNLSCSPDTMPTIKSSFHYNTLTDHEDDDNDMDEAETEHIDFAALKGNLPVFVSSNEDPHKYVFYSQQTGLLRHHRLAHIGKSRGIGVRCLSDIMRNEPFWLDICDPVEGELKALAEVFKMHLLTLEDLQWEEPFFKAGVNNNDSGECNSFHYGTGAGGISIADCSREKCDVFAKYYFVSVKAYGKPPVRDPQGEEEGICKRAIVHPVHLYMLVSPSCVVTIHREPLAFTHTIAKRISRLTARTGLTSDWIVYTILEDVLEMLVPFIRAAEAEIDEIDDLVESRRMVSVSDSSADLLDRINGTRKHLTQLLRMMSGKSELLRVIAKRAGSRFSEDALVYLRDLQDHTAMLEQTLHHYDESLNRSHANYLAHISIEISVVSNRMSDVMKKLTAISTVTLPWSMITGLMGMNVFVPGGGSYYTFSLLPWACFFIAMTSLSILIYAVGRRRDWF